MSALRVVASGVGVAIGAGAIVTLVASRTRLPGAFPELRVYPTTVPTDRINYWAPSEYLQATVALSLTQIFAIVGRSGAQTAEQYLAKVQNDWSSDGVTANLAVTVDWVLLEWRWP